ncbi:MAG: glycoside hydrolase family 15 protein [Nitrososphaerota archaeon]|jgi:GH15 family glucan-1,4-alpha-glucosidase|nr:glycoside hydrolase family 15 protein [Nitrososphaerota archaeon]MDG6932001.1 glycoside hydrolase family 15 protein [Nitrososphaerota archaeon]MDG6936707.1 glycoside hydrolase family 15 protein [Nitrososphaerota archaeon]MDG6944512.1 glycoside hydrolase family 15 protein [Nitrososphaerota archaeon]
MVRYLPIGNNRLLVSFDKDYRIVDMYYAHDQAENHVVGHPFRYGISVDGNFRWIDRSAIKYMDYLDDTLISDVKYTVGSIDLNSQDFVDIYDDVYVRKISAKNSGNSPQEVKFFFHQDFYIYGNDIGDTAFYHPQMNSVVHYKNKRQFLISTIDGSNNSMDQYAIGIKGFKGYEGTWKDAEDGKLSFNAVAIGSVDSVVGHTLFILPDETKDLYYFIISQENLDSLVRLKKGLNVETLRNMLRRTGNYWTVWNEKKQVSLPQEMLALFRKSQFIIRIHMNNRGALMASSDSDILKNSRDGYYYVWPRDAAIASYALTATLHFSAARKFYDFALSTISDEGYFYHKYLPDGNIASSWIPRIINSESIIPIQEDETSLVIWSLWQYYQQSLDIEYFFPLYENLIKKGANFLLSYVNDEGLPKASYDLWEERFGIHTYTVATTYAALKAASEFAKTFRENDLSEKYSLAADRMASAFEGRFYSQERGYYARAIINGSPDFTVDSQNMALFIFGMKDPADPKLRSNMDAIMQKLWVKGVGGLARYEGDMYQRVKDDNQIPGNPWIITTLWASRYFAMTGNHDRSLSLLKWVIDHSQHSGVLPEQVNPYDGSPLSVSPLIWSHAEYIITVIELLKKGISATTSAD